MRREKYSVRAILKFISKIVEPMLIVRELYQSTVTYRYNYDRHGTEFLRKVSQ